MSARRRLDRELVARGIAADLDEARGLLLEGKILVAGSQAVGPGRLVSPGDPIRLAPGRPRFVSRGGEKLSSALERFGVGVAGKRCFDAGAGTGGFTDCLLQAGAESVTAVDVGRGQLHQKLREDDRVTSVEGVNLRIAPPGTLGGPFDLITADLSFISLEAVLDTLVSLAAGHTDLLLLVKPQFEAARGRVPRGGVVKDPASWMEVLERIYDALRVRGTGVLGIRVAEPTGSEGNREFFIHGRRGAEGAAISAVSNAVEEARGLARHSGP